MSQNNKVLDVSNLVAGYGKTPILQDVDLVAYANQVAVIVGPNGAGKSTLLKAIFRLNQCFDGDIQYLEQSILALNTDSLVPLGIACVPQTQNVFQNLSVAENLEIGTYAISSPNIKQSLEEVLQLFPDLKGKLNQAAGQLSGGQRQMVAIGRALMSRPKLLLLDEPTAGLSPAYLEIIFDLILQIKATGVAIVMVEQNAKQALRIADSGYVLANGKNAFTGTGESLLANDEVRRSFLGGGAAQ